MTAIPPPIDRNISKLRSSVKEGVDVQGSPPQIIPSGRCGRKATLDVHDRKYTALRWLLQTWTGKPLAWRYFYYETQQQILICSRYVPTLRKQFFLQFY